MKKTFKRVLSTVFVVLILLTSAPLQDFVDLDWSCLDFSVKASAVSGSCGPNARWEYYSSTGKLYIYGTGEITYQSSGTKYPWHEYSYTTVDVAEGITKIPSYTFEYCSTVRTINLPDSLEYLALNAFNDCSNLNNLVLPDSIVEFTYNCFNRCPKLTDVYYMGTEEEWKSIKNATSVWFFPTGQEHTIHYLIDLSVKPTCQHEGTETYYQFDKTDVYNSLYDANKKVITNPVVLPIVDHSFTKYESDNNFTCIDDGTKTAYCDYSCGTKNTIIDENSAGHKYESQIIKQPSHKEEGVENLICVCGDTYTKVVAKTPHSYSKVVTAPTCTEQGYTTYTCECGDTYVDDYIACHTDVQGDNYCDVCGEYIRVIKETGYCGENISYTLCEDGTLFISGNGEIWKNAFRDNSDIKK